jgi:preprotein translocase subunit SecD
LRVRLFLIGATVAVFGYLAVANFFDAELRRESPLLPDSGLRLGLDLQGGIHWVLGVQLDVTEKRELEFQGKGVAGLAKDEGFSMSGWSVDDGVLTLEGLSVDGVSQAREYISNHGGLRETDEDAGDLRVELTDDWNSEVRERGMNQVLEVLRRRIDDPVIGIPESVVTRQGDDRILVQIPGGTEFERERAGKLLKTTGFLEFKIVQDFENNRELLLDKYPDGLPAGMQISVETDLETGRELTAYLVPEAADVTGDYLEDARVVFNRQGRPIVSFTFNPEGGRIFGEVTGSNIGAPLAIILDNNVYSAPNIKSRINMRGQIEGRYTSQEAADLAVVLRAGSLAVPVVIEEERTVGPALGADSISRGVRASVLGLVLILVFVIAYYRLSGVYAGIALLANLLLLIGVMSLFEATLTLPGLAGVVLTVGMAVDANVIIFERIREELRGGRAPRAAVSTGFSKALWTILDANITTLMTAIVLYEYGTGPIKGFAVTLSIGVMTSVFAALVITRAMFMIYPGSRPVETVSI